MFGLREAMLASFQFWTWHWKMADRTAALSISSPLPMPGMEWTTARGLYPTGTWTIGLQCSLGAASYQYSVRIGF